MSYGTYCGKCSEYTANYTTRRDDEGKPMIVCVECPKDKVNRIYQENAQLRAQLSDSLAREKVLRSALENIRYNGLKALAATAEKEEPNGY